METKKQNKTPTRRELNEAESAWLGLSESEGHQPPKRAPEPTKYESTTQPGLYFWAEKNELDGTSWCVVSQASGYPATEAHDDWFAYQVDADAIARQLAKGGDK